MNRFCPKTIVLWTVLAISGTLVGFSRDTSLPSLIGLKGHKVQLVQIPTGFISLPPKPPSAGILPEFQDLPGFWMTRSEIQVETFCQFLTVFPNLAAPYHGQVTRCRGQVRPLPGFRRKPVTHVSVDDAVLFCQWLSQVSGRTCRLPMPAEWVHMASSGHSGNAYPWGWESASTRAVFQQHGPREAGFFGPGGYGLVDVIGNVYEWSLDPIHRNSYLHGGAWSDRHEFSLSLHNLYEQAPSHRSADIGFRVLVEMPPGGDPTSLTSSSKAL